MLESYRIVAVEPEPAFAPEGIESLGGTDKYGVYNWRPANRHEARKGREVNRNEGLHSVLRGKLNRLARKTKGDAKVKEMLIGSLALRWLRQGWI